MPSTAPSCAIVIFGASGDLAQRKLIPALYEMAREKLLNDHSYIVGFARSPMTDEQYRKESFDAVMKFARTKRVD
jgi:glucose-6-phosphate 1-dehydrogenase